MNHDELTTAFLEEARELLESMQQALLAFDDDNAGDTVQTVFRAAHTIKGSAGVVRAPGLVRFAHVLESELEALRASPERLTAAIVVLLTEAHDELARFVDAIDHGAVHEGNTALLAQLTAALHASSSSSSSSSSTPPSPTDSTSTTYDVRVRFAPETFHDGFDPLSVIDHLATQGTVAGAQLTAPALRIEGYDPLECQLVLLLSLTSSRPESALRAGLALLPPGTEVSIAPASSAAESSSSSSSETPEALSSTAEEMVGPTKGEARAAERSVKVPAARLDTLVDLVGELVTASGAAGVHVAATGDRRAIEAMASVQKIVSSVRDAALGLRMVQIGDTFNRFRRVVREVSARLQKDVEVQIRGGETELDKAMVERLADPLIHIVRNAIDHGIEAPDARVAAGKPRRGTLTLEARHQAGQIVIDVSDDGAGINREKVKKKAIEKGLIPANAQLTDAEIDEIIFMPGFSSADAITDVSGRGVGMDVVRKSIDQLRGQVEVLSTFGQGTTIRLRLPLTLAIIDGFLVSVGEAHFVVPSKLVRECLDFATTVDSEANHRLNVRGQAVPYVQLRDVFALGGVRPRRESILIIEHGDAVVAVVVDRLLGVSQTVIKPLGPIFRQHEAIGGSTVLGSGEVALILDVPQLVRLAGQHRSHRTRTASLGAQERA